MLFSGILYCSDDATLWFEGRNTMLVWVLVVTALLVGDVAGTRNSLVLERTQRHLEKRELSRGPCEENWFHFPLLNSCYRFFSDKMTWHGAQNFCSQDAHCGHLASVTSDEHNIFISNVVTIVDKEKPVTWIGLNDICKEGNFTWIDELPYSYKNFGPGEPNHKENKEHCVNIHHFRNTSWNDESCEEPFGFVCSYKLC
ncbi:C-type lectin mannose-binding isoform-like isoform X2 [Hypanus sabinus]|uniref:C-type lectin mannose-binding isoform-like isoform X2 n=1 Tax=Hypanus sabinus TaxID=79690 RepID=UPI0028C4F629|nr:C-type lectin mannose-binding isoform-like isoform X2 [Hypanus sabinus]